jgi:hypothetical protein
MICIGWAESSLSNRSSYTAVAFRQKTAKFTPPSSGMALRGWKRPGEVA